MTREKNYSYEALAEATNCDMDASRGELNIALKTIKEQSLGMSDYALADEIHARAKSYRDVMGEGILLTPTALAKHWVRVFEEARKPKPKLTTNQHSSSDCETCGGDRFVVVFTRKPLQTQWMNELGIIASDDNIEEYAACPKCNTSETSFWRYDGTKSSPPDPARVQELMRG